MRPKPKTAPVGPRAQVDWVGMEMEAEVPEVERERIERVAREFVERREKAQKGARSAVRFVASTLCLVGLIWSTWRLWGPDAALFMFFAQWYVNAHVDRIKEG